VGANVVVADFDRAAFMNVGVMKAPLVMMITIAFAVSILHALLHLLAYFLVSTVLVRVILAIAIFTVTMRSAAAGDVVIPTQEFAISQVIQSRVYHFLLVHAEVILCTSDQVGRQQRDEQQ